MAIKMSEKLQKVVKELGLKEENILYMNIQRPFLERILSEEKKVEFRDLSEYWLKKLNNYDKKTLACIGAKPIKYILFQNGMNAESAPRALVESKNVIEKWSKDDKGNPAEVITRDRREDRDSFRYTIEEGKAKYPRVFQEAEFEDFDINDEDEEFLALELGKIVYREHI